MDQPGSNRVAARKQSPPVAPAPKSVEPMAAAGDIGPITAYEQLAALSIDGRPDPTHVLALQRAAGNRAVSRFMAERTLQTAVNVARRIDRLDDEDMPGSPAPRPGAGFEAAPDFEGHLNAARGRGAPLPDSTRAFMEQRIGADFGAVKVHTDARSDALNQAIQARAFTTGQDVFFRQGEFAPATSGGKELIAHELTHVVQQTGAALRAPAEIAQPSAASRAIQAKGALTAQNPNQTSEPLTPTLEEELIAEGVADTTSFAGPAQESGGLAKLGASIRSAVRPNLTGNPVKIAIDKLDRAAVDRIVDLLAAKQLACTAQQLSWLGQRASALQADPGSYETTLAKELAWEKVASIAELDRPGLERILRLIQDKKLKAAPGELQQLGRRRQALGADASAYETTLANELDFEQVKSISELDRDGLDRILTLIQDDKLLITGTERQQLGRRRQQVGGASTPGEITLAEALAREGVETIGALDFDGVERVTDLVSEKKLRLEPAQRQELGRRRSALAALGGSAPKLSMTVALAREDAETIGLLDLAGVDGIVELLAQKRLAATSGQIQQLGERRRQLLTSARTTVEQHIKAHLPRKAGAGIMANRAGVKRIADLTESEAEAILDLIEKRELRATNQEIYALSRFRKDKPEARQRYETTFEEQLAWEGATTVDELSVEAAEKIRELVADKKLKVTTAQMQQLAARRKEKPPTGDAGKTTLEEELARQGAATIEELDQEGVDAIRRLVAEKKLDLTVYYVQELGRRQKALKAAERAEDTTLEVEMAREGLEAQEFDKLDREGVERLFGLVEAGMLKPGMPALLALGRQRTRMKAAPADAKTTLESEMARHGATEIEQLDLEGVEAILELTAASDASRLDAPVETLRRLGQQRRKLLEKRETERTLAWELKTRKASGIDDLELDALDEIYERVHDGKLKMLPSQREHLERRRKQEHEAAIAGKPKLEELLAWEGAANIADLEFEAVGRILDRIRYDALTVQASALLELVKRRKALATEDLPTGTLEEELANDGALTLANLDSGGADRIWSLIEDGKLEVSNLQLLELARRRKAVSAPASTVETSLADELAERDVDGIAELDLKGVTEIWKLVDRAAIELSPDQLRALAQRRKAVLSAPRTYETTLEYELARAKVNSIADLDMNGVANILERAEAGDLELTDGQRAHLVRRQKEEAYDGRALKALLAGERERIIGKLPPLTVSILMKLAEEKKLPLSADQRRELNLRRKGFELSPQTLEDALARVGATSIEALKDRNRAQQIWTLALDQVITLEPAEITRLAKKAGRGKAELLDHAENQAKRLEERLSAYDTGAQQQKGSRRMSMTASVIPPSPDSESPTVGVISEPSLRMALLQAGVSRIADLGLTEAENIIAQIELNLFTVTNDELRQLVRLRNDERKKLEPEATTLERELGLEGATSITDLDLHGVESIIGLITEGRLTLEISKRRELARRRAEMLSAQKPEALSLETELANAGVVDIAGLDADGVQAISAAVQYGGLEITPAQRRQLARRRKELQGADKTLAEALAAEGVDAISALDLEGVERIIELVEGSLIKVEATQLRGLYWREDELSKTPPERSTLVRELISVGADSIQTLDSGNLARLIKLVDVGTLTVDVESRRALYQLDAQMNADEVDETEQEGETVGGKPESSGAPGGTTQPEVSNGPVVPSRRLRSNATGQRDLPAELARLKVDAISGLDLAAVKRLLGLVEDGKLKAETNQRRALYRRHAQLTEPQTVDEVTAQEGEIDYSQDMEDSGQLPDTEDADLELAGYRESLEDTRETSLAGLEFGPTTRQRSNARSGRNPLASNFSLVLARLGVKDIASLDRTGVELIKERVRAGELVLTTVDAAALGERWRELERIEQLGQVSFEHALAREGAADISDLDLDAVESIRGLIGDNKIKPIPDNPALLELGQRRKALLSQQNQGRTTLQAELGREKAKAVGDLELAGVERIRGLIAAKMLEVAPADLLALAQRRAELLSKGATNGPTLADELALEGVDAIDALDLEGTQRIRKLVADKALTVTPDQLNALGKRRMALLAGPDAGRTTLEAELALEGVSKISELDRAGVSRIKELVTANRLEISLDQLTALGLRLEALPPEETMAASLEAELAKQGVASIADLDLDGVKEVRDLVRLYGLEVTDDEADLLRRHEESLTDRLTLADFLGRMGANNVASLDRAAIIDLWGLIGAERLVATPDEIREIVVRYGGGRAEPVTLSAYLADSRNLTNDGRDARTIEGLDAREIDAISNLIEAKRLSVTLDELRALARRRKELRNASEFDPTTLADALGEVGAKDIASLALDQIQSLWARVTAREVATTPDERKQLGLRRRTLLNESRTLKAAVAAAGASAIADLESKDAIALWERVAAGELTANADDRRLLGERRKRALSGSGTLAYELEKAGVKDIASLDADAVEELWWRVTTGNLTVSLDALRELARRHKYETGSDVRQRELEALKDLAGEDFAQRAIQTKRIVGPMGDRYEQEADRVARQVRGPPAKAQSADAYYRVPAYPQPGAAQVQAKLTVGPAGDRYEQEADRVARQVIAMRIPGESGDDYYAGNAYSSPSPPTPAMARAQPPTGADDVRARSLAQRAGSAFDAGTAFEERLEEARAGGAPLPEATRAFMERRMGADFGGIKLHTDAQSGQLNRMIQAKAFTTGGDVFFGSGEYNPDSAAGRELLAHELAHTVQQGAAPIQPRTAGVEAQVAASDPPESAGPAPVGGEIDTGTQGPIIQRHLLGNLGDLGRSILTTLASIPENLWAVLRPAASVTPGPSALRETPPPTRVPDVQPPQRDAPPVEAPPTIDQPVTSSEALTPESIRAKVNLFDPTGGDVVRYISDRITEVGRVKDLLFVVPRARLVVALADDMAARGGGGPVDETHRQAAEREVANGGGGFTALDGRIFILDTAEESSALFHEVIHVLSGPGGATPLAQLKIQLNEGFTNYFAEEVAKLVGGEIYAAYPFPTEWARKFVAAHGRDAAYSLYFKGNLDLLYEKMAGFLLKQAKANALTATEANLLKLRGEWSMDKALAMVKAKVKGADFFDQNAVPNKWFDGRVF